MERTAGYIRYTRKIGEAATGNKPSSIPGFHTIPDVEKPLEKVYAMNETMITNSLILAVRHDLSRGLKKEEVLRSLSRVISQDLMKKVREQL
jgi:hypothetical protein